ncbi:E3 ubiquitin-protein ligase RNF170 [Merluccius polli]|uniref:E3 ubiquitin-protein ligase RNF170 n=1 Tax=Merluccius polli TaxID=89951 RepID=A0AA47PB23_MERPO|nr:E3 ubiquitin-protein ligase RNF170 [Merluccius polli]
MRTGRFEDGLMQSRQHRETSPAAECCRHREGRDYSQRALGPLQSLSPVFLPHQSQTIDSSAVTWPSVPLCQGHAYSQDELQQPTHIQRVGMLCHQRHVRQREVRHLLPKHLKIMKLNPNPRRRNGLREWRITRSLTFAKPNRIGGIGRKSEEWNTKGAVPREDWTNQLGDIGAVARPRPSTPLSSRPAMDRRRSSSQPGRDVSHREGPMGRAGAGSPSSSRSASSGHTMGRPEASSQSCSLMGNRDGHCPVCLQTANFPVTTNCGHLFCATCLIAYWRYGSWLSAISCPVCRQEVNTLHRLFSESESDRRSKEVVGDIRDYNKRYSGAPRKVMDYLCDAPLLLHLWARGLTAVGGLVCLFFFRVALCCVGTVVSFSSHPLHTVSPSSSPSSSSLETHQSLCGLLGILDDLVVVVLLLICVINIHQQMAPERGRSASALATRGVL